MLISLKSTLNYKINASDGLFGCIKDVYFDDADWFVKYFVAETGSLFRSRKVLLTSSQVERVDHSRRTVSVSMSSNDIANAPRATTHKPVSVQMKEIIRKQYRKLRQRKDLKYTRRILSIVQPLQPDPHLRSLREVLGYHVFSFSGPCGRVGDFLAYETGWNIRYLVVHLRGLLRDRKFLVSPQSAQRIVWEGKRIEMETSEEMIKSSPECDVCDRS